MDNTDKPLRVTLHWTNVGWSSERDLSILKRGRLRLRDFLNREEKPSRQVAMVGNFLILNKTVVLQIWQKKAKTLTCMAFLHLIALRNKMVAHAFLLLFDNANDRLCQERLLGKSEEELP